MYQSILINDIYHLSTVMLVNHFFSEFIIIKSKSINEPSENTDLLSVYFLFKLSPIYNSILINEFINIEYLDSLKPFEIHFGQIMNRFNKSEFRCLLFLMYFESKEVLFIHFLFSHSFQTVNVNLIPQTFIFNIEIALVSRDKSITFNEECLHIQIVIE